MNTPTLTAHEKALALNLDGRSYGSIAEIGGGQEVSRWFFRVGGAAGTVARTISAYDMAISDRMYGVAKPYVSRMRLNAMLDLEFGMVSEQLKEKFGATKGFFAFANTVATRKFHSPEHGRGWMGIRFQTKPREEASQITLHAHLLDIDADREQDALGILGVNLIYGAFFLHSKPVDLIASLMDDLTRERIEIDMIKFDGPAFKGTDNRLMSLQLVENAFTDAAMFTADGEVVQPSEVLYKKPILIERGHFRPVSKLTVDVLERARDAFMKEPGVEAQQPVVLAEMTLRNLMQSSATRHEDFLSRADILGALGYDVLISRFAQNFEMAEYLTTYTDKPTGIAVGLPTVRQFVEEPLYTGLGGGVLEGIGRLFRRSVKIYVYPALDRKTGKVETIDDLVIPNAWQHLFRLLLELGRFQSIKPSDEALLSIDHEDLMRRISARDGVWETMVPSKAAEIIKTKNLFFEKATAGSPVQVEA